MVTRRDASTTCLNVVIFVLVVGASSWVPNSSSSQPVPFIARQLLFQNRRLQCTVNAFTDVARITRCYSCAVPPLDPCVYDTVSCRGMPPGGSCEIRCKDPYVGVATLAYCPLGNNEPSGMIQWSLPDCRFITCPDPPREKWPRGYYYNFAAREWECNVGFGGRPVRVCATDPSNCVDRYAAFSGCLPVQPCAVPPLQFGTCAFDYTACVGMGHGRTCQVGCRYPYGGTAGIAQCPEGNTDPGTLVEMVQPAVCELSCPSVLANAPPGYQSYQGQWQCSEGWIGEPVEQCDVDTNCNPLTGMIGCTEIVPCLPLDLVGTCELDIADCGEQLDAGQRCELTCKAPYDGAAGYAECPAGNTDPTRKPKVVLPTCYPACQHTENPPAGYEFFTPRNAFTGAWRCAPRYGGTVERVCTINDDDCSENVTFSGCELLRNCLLPDLGWEACKLDISGCRNKVLVGQSCVIGCKSPIYAGTAGVAICPGDNTDPERMAHWESGPPSCTASECDLIPAGYMKTKEGWRCAVGYAGKAIVHFANCDEDPVLTGCKRLTTCADLDLELENAVNGMNCSYDASSCRGVFAGESCAVACRAPFAGNSTLVRCPGDNTDPTYKMSFTLPECVLHCSNPDPEPEGYTLQDGSWQCAYGYWGNVTEECRIGPNCTDDLNLTGCVPLSYCRPLDYEMDGINEERVNISLCENVMSGETCEISCNYPFLGSSTFGLCPVGVTVEDDLSPEVIFSTPFCRFECDPVPPGYVKTPDGWRCATSHGWYGNATQSCTDSGRCDAEVQLTGCKRKTRCKTPEIDECRYNISDCRNVPAGGTCVVGCFSPYNTSMASILRCPELNTDPEQEPVGAYPQCTFSACPEPNFIPYGYQVDDSSGAYQCTPEFGGTPFKVCTTSAYPECEVLNGTLAGCGLLVDCAPLVSHPDPCAFDVSNCSNVPGGVSCDVECRDPYVGNGTRARCPTSNTDPLRQPQWVDEAPECTLVCPDPNPTPRGYVRVTPHPDGWRPEDLQNGWQCAPGWLGEAVARCEVGAAPDCSVRLALTGCIEIVPCAPLNVSDCSVNASDCSSVASGSSCIVRCRNGYEDVLEQNVTESNFALCPANNTDPMQELIGGRVPNCSFVECVEAPPMGYTRTDGELQCSDGWFGNASGTCTHDDECAPQYSVTGCYFPRPCIAPPLDACKYDLAACAQVTGGTSCALRCRDPYIGTVGSLSCPWNNTDASQPASSQLPLCTPNCTNASALIPRGSAYTRLGEQECSNGFVGNGTVTCFVDKQCRLALEMTGCEPIPPCLPPIVDVCQFNASNCDNVQAGSSCEIECVEPYRGNSSTATCPSEKTMEREDLQPLPPTPCHLVCQDPNPWPAGYVKLLSGTEVGIPLGDNETINSSAMDVWKCDAGYTGKIDARCMLVVEGDDCDPENFTRSVGAYLALSGCIEEKPCRPTYAYDIGPDFRVPHCALEIVDDGCLAVEPGEHCTVHCKSPYVGATIYPSCPAHNTNPLQPLLHPPSPCSLDCPDPPELDGYEIADIYVVTFKRTGCPNFRWSQYYSERWKFNKWCDPEFTGSLCIPNSVAMREMYDICVKTQLKEGYQEEWFLCMGEGNYGAPETCTLQTRWSLENNLDWVCSEGYSGYPDVKCTTDAACNPFILRQGCYLLTPCLPLDQRTNDVCQYDVSGCPGLQPGGECIIRCRDPYLAITWTTETPNGTIVMESEGHAYCPATNDDPMGRIIVTKWPECIFYCADPIPVPEGYVKAGTDWHCADTHTGTALLECYARNNYRAATDQMDCKIVSAISGCVPTVPCTPPDPVEFADYPCQFDSSDCIGVPAGGTCEIRCKNPFAGQPTIATCAEGNIDPYKVVDWAPPTCELVCPDPEGLPDGYNFTEDPGEVYPPWSRRRSWRCAEWYTSPTGWVNETCEMRRNFLGAIDLQKCEAVQDLVGCEPILPCAPLRIVGVQACFTQVGCELLPAGGTCEVRCRLPCKDPDLPDGIVGRSTFTCPEGNVDPSTQPQGLLPNCAYTCDPIPAGYLRTAEKWTCAEGFIGKAEETCVPGSLCETELSLTGCAQLFNCTPPVWVDQCRYALEECTNLARGANCQIGCREPYIGDVTNASCGAFNTNPYGLEFTLPDCDYNPCPDPSYHVEGYKWTGAEWTCDDGYAGHVVRYCGTENNYPICTSVAKFTGCLPLQPCSDPRPLPWLPSWFRTSPPYLQGTAWNYEDPCEVDFSNCENMNPGDNCTLNCTFPFVLVEEAVAHCPVTNTDASKGPEYRKPVCRLTCPDPEVHEGYVKDASGAWQCAPQYLGTAVGTCYSDKYCQSWMVLSGCLKLWPCGNVEIQINTTQQYLGQCAYNYSNGCDWLESGESCFMGCRSPLPYVGDDTEVKCVTNYTDGSSELEYTLPPCRLACPDVDWWPDGPRTEMDADAGYMEDPITGQWRCMYEYNWTGLANVTCEIDKDTCISRLKFRGCQKKVHCRTIDARTMDTCTYDFSSCGSQAPGTTCAVSCKPPFTQTGQDGLAKCPDNNTLAYGSLDLQPPQCDLFCDDPPVVPIGYELKSVEHRRRRVWGCAAGYAGTVSKACSMDFVYTNGQRRCRFQTQLGGCLPLARCAPPPIPDRVCGIDISSCKNISAGSTCYMKCVLGWRLEGTTQPGTCPATNTDPTYPVQFARLPTCVFMGMCQEPSILEPGYVSTPWWIQPRVYSCDKTYTGTVTTRCVENTFTCTGDFLVEGCSPMSPCQGPKMDMCGRDLTNCSILQPNTTCAMVCIPGYIGDATVGVCPDGNRDINGLDWTMPTCTFRGCPVPETPPEGYMLENQIQYAVAGQMVGWICTEGYHGIPDVFCHECKAQLTFSGCKKIVPCPVNISSEEICPPYDFSDCGGGVNLTLDPGESCELRCADGYVGAPQIAHCPSTNTDPEFDIIPETLNCRVLCLPPIEDVAPAYHKTSDGEWICAEGYTGNAVAACELFDNCTSAPVDLSGCQITQPCASFDYDVCKMDGSQCHDVQAGSSCEVRCIAPRNGSSQTGVCYAENTDRSTPLQLTVPRCQWHKCPDPIPEGYMKTWRGWECAPGYSGIVTVKCGPECCDAPLLLSGCQEIVPCVFPESLDTCMYDTEGCNRVTERCPLQCREPFVGTRTWASCPTANVNPAQLFQFTKPSCTLTCPELVDDDIPRGYVRSPNGGFECDAGFVGSAFARCTIFKSSCTSRYVLHGCNEVIECEAPDVMDACRFDVSSCNDTVEVGESCVVRCRQPYRGNSTTAKCPQRNVRVDGLDLVWPACELTCLDPDETPQGYALSDDGVWQCEEGYAGQAVRTCILGGDCSSRAVFSGCTLIVPCAIMDVPDPCMVDVSECVGVKAGDTCTLWCRPPYGGAPTVAECPAENTDPNRQTTYKLPFCTCADPRPAPEGYQKAQYGWQCSGGFAGKAALNCEAPPGAPCLRVAELSGCSPVVPCEVGQFTDVDPRRGFIEGVFSFGAAQTGAVVDESPVLQYRVYFADKCGTPIGDPIGKVDRIPQPTITSCCWSGTYEYVLRGVELPDEAAQLMAVTVTVLGQARAGRGTPLLDQGASGDAQVSSTGDASRQACMFIKGIATLAALVSAVLAF